MHAYLFFYLSDVSWVTTSGNVHNLKFLLGTLISTMLMLNAGFESHKSLISIDEIIQLKMFDYLMHSILLRVK